MKSPLTPAERPSSRWYSKSPRFRSRETWTAATTILIRRLEHFLASAIFVRPAFDEAARSPRGTGMLIRRAVEVTSGHSGGNTHFGAFILLIPLIQGGDIPGAVGVVQHTDTGDAVEFYRAFGLTSVRMLARDELDVHDPGVLDQLRARKMTLLDVMRHSAETTWSRGNG